MKAQTDSIAAGGRRNWPSPGIAGAARPSVLCSAALVGLLVVALASTATTAQSPPAQHTVEGKARIVDGDTLEIGVHRIDLYGIDAPEATQECQREGKAWRCGLEAIYAMAALLEFNWLTCQRRDTVAPTTMFAECRIGGPKGFSVNREIVRRGWALAAPATGADYAAAEREARAARAGLWSGSFMAPWEWRRANEIGNKSN